jgi:hypothetical protein
MYSRNTASDNKAVLEDRGKHEPVKTIYCIKLEEVFNF